MPIKGLTDRQSATPRFTRLGKIKKGTMETARNGKTKPVDLDYFRFVPEGPNAKVIGDAFRDAYGDAPREITVYLPYASVDENWQTWMEEWGKSGLIHRCDSEIMTQWINDDKTYTLDLRQERGARCPYASGEKQRTARNPGCTQVGRLAVIIPELLMAGFVGYVTVEIHSVNDLANINNSLLDAEGKAQAAGRPNGLQGVEFRLRRVPETIGVRYQGNNGDVIKTQAEKWMVRLDPAREWVLKQLETSKQLALGYRVERPSLVMDVEPVMVMADGGADLLPDDVTEGPGVVEADYTEAPDDDPELHWTSDDASVERLVAWADSQGLKIRDIEIALGVDAIVDFTGTKAAAKAYIDDYIARNRDGEHADEDHERPF